jgi:23S rRNA (uracil1939-C5)-methyltransferase
MPGSGRLVPTPLRPDTRRARVASLDQEGRGVTRDGGKVVFIDDALPGEEVEFRVWRHKPRYDLANVIRVVHESSQRVDPPCPHYERCGGCSLQHFEARAQVAVKQRVLEDALSRIGKVEPQMLLPPIHGPSFDYRHRARMSVRYVAGKGGALVGFRERRTHFVVEMDSCAVLADSASYLIGPLREMISGLDLAARIPQVEIAVLDTHVALTLRVLDPMDEGDRGKLRAFVQSHAVDIYLQFGGPDVLEPLIPDAVRPLYYRLPEFDLRLEFEPADFTQVNPSMNRMLVRRALALLEPKPGERIADLFCGIGNFTLAIARSGAQVVGVEGLRSLVQRAQHNAELNGLAQRARFVVADLSKRAALLELGPVDRLLLDPARDGALQVVTGLTDPMPHTIVYVSCNPATLARDAGVLVHDKGYELRTAGVLNMFPHTAHVESIALFVRAQKENGAA